MLSFHLSESLIACFLIHKSLTHQEFVEMLNLTPRQKVLDVGCGIGGGDFYMAKVSGQRRLMDSCREK